MFAGIFCTTFSLFGLLLSDFGSYVSDFKLRLRSVRHDARNICEIMYEIKYGERP
jgi:hypothetical protein